MKLIKYMELRVGGKYRLTKKLGSGAFGEVFLGTIIQRKQFDILIILI